MHGSGIAGRPTVSHPSQTLFLCRITMQTYNLFLVLSCTLYYDPEETVSWGISEGGQWQWGEYKKNAVNPWFLYFLLFRLRKTSQTETGDGHRRKRNIEQAFCLCLDVRRLPEINCWKYQEMKRNEKASSQQRDGHVCVWGALVSLQTLLLILDGCAFSVTD